MTDNTTHDMYEALVKIREVVNRRLLPITNQVWEIADRAVKKAAQDLTRKTT